MSTKNQPQSLKYLSAICFKHQYYRKVMQLENMMSRLYTNDIIKRTTEVNKQLDAYRQSMKPFLPESIRLYLNSKKRCCVYKHRYVTYLKIFYGEPDLLRSMEKVSYEEAERFDHKECLIFFKRLVYWWSLPW